MNYISLCLGNLLCMFPITSDCDTTAFTQASTLFFFFPAPRLRVDTHSCFPCRVSPNQWYRATREPTGTDTAPAEGQSSSGRQCFPPHLVPVTGLQKVSTGTSTNPSPNNVALCAFLSFPGSLSFIPPFCLLESHPK